MCASCESILQTRNRLRCFSNIISIERGVWQLNVYGCVTLNQSKEWMRKCYWQTQSLVYEWHTHLSIEWWTNLQIDHMFLIKLINQSICTYMRYVYCIYVYSDIKSQTCSVTNFTRAKHKHISIIFKIVSFSLAQYSKYSIYNTAISILMKTKQHTHCIHMNSRSIVHRLHDMKT